MNEVGFVAKDGKNAHFKYRYTSAEAVLNKVRSALIRQNVSLSSQANVAWISPDGKNAVVHMRLTFHLGDESASVEGLGQGSDSTDKAVMKANTAALKYALANAFLISFGDDPEADSSIEKIVDEDLRDKLMASIEAAQSKAELNRLKSTISSMSSSPFFDNLKDAFVARSKEMS